MTTKYVRIEEDKRTDTTHVLHETRNGSQWNQVVIGSLNECKVIREAFYEIGYKDQE